MPEPSVVVERFRSRLWPIPTVAAVAAALLAVGSSMVRPGAGDARVWWVGEASSARGLLEVLVGSSLTVVALVFSLQVVALQLAASQYSPRLLRTYVRDAWIQASLAVLIATFVFSLVTLALFGAPEDPPWVSVSVAVLLGLASVGALLAVVSHIVSSLRVETMMAEIDSEAAEVLAGSLGAADVGPPPVGWPAVGADRGSPVRAPRAGFVQAIDRRRLLRWASANDAHVRIDATAGSHVLAGREIGRIWSSSDDATPVSDAVLIGFERTPDEDLGFGLLQLVDVAVRALSPSVNDPTTAVHAISHLARLAGLIADHVSSTADHHCVADEDGEVRVVVRLPLPRDLLSLICRPIVRSGAAHPEALLGLVDLLRYVGQRSAPLRPAAQDEARYLVRAAERDVVDDEDRRRVLDAARTVLGGDW